MHPRSAQSARAITRAHIATHAAGGGQRMYVSAVSRSSVRYGAAGQNPARSVCEIAVAAAATTPASALSSMHRNAKCANCAPGRVASADRSAMQTSSANALSPP
jgi:hypothetical protein